MNKGIQINCPEKYNFINIIMKIIKYIWIIIPVGIIIYGIVEFIINIPKVDIKDKSNRIPKLLKKNDNSFCHIYNNYVNTTRFRIIIF